MCVCVCTSACAHVCEYVWCVYVHGFVNVYVCVIYLCVCVLVGACMFKCVVMEYMCNNE